MDAALDLTGYAHALGRAQAAWRFASAELRRAAALAAISATWETFRRDAGAGAVGPAHEAAPAQLPFAEDPRRDAVLLWLADYGAPAIADAAGTVARMVAATRRFDTDQHALLDAARDALAVSSPVSGPIVSLVTGTFNSAGPVIESLGTIAGAVERLHSDAGFLESEGAEVRHTLPRGTLSRYVPTEPAGCWALNLALLGHGATPAGALPPVGLVSRVLFRGDLDAEDIAVRLRPQNSVCPS